MVAHPPSSAPVAASLRGVLAAGLVSAAALVWAALALVDEPSSAAQVALARLAAEVDATVERELVRTLEGVAFGSERALLVADEELPPAVTPRELPGAGRPRSAFAALLHQSQRFELADGQPAEALQVAREALAAAEDDGERARAWLRLAQLAAALDDRVALAGVWRDARAGLTGDETCDGTSWLLLIGLAAEPVWGTTDRAWLTRAWIDGALPDGAGPPRFVARGERVVIEQDPARLAVRARLRRGLDAAQAELFDAVCDRPLAARALAATFGEPASQPSPRRPDDGAAPVQPVAPGAGATSPTTTRAGLVRRGELVLLPRGLSRRTGGLPAVTTLAALRTALRAGLSSLPEGFVVGLDLDPPEHPSARATRLRGPTELPGLGLSWTLRHRDADGLLDELANRSGWQRAALLLAAAFALVATAVAVVALRREARLAALKNAFVASVSHELRTPVAAIQLLTENLQRGLVTDVPRYHAALRTESLRLGRLVDDVLDVSRLQRGEPTRLQLEPVDAAELVDALARDAAEHVAAAGGALVVAPLPDAWPVEASLSADREALRRALLNLLDNALRHGAGTAPPELHARVDGGQLELALRDHGPGVERGRRAALFRPFEQGPGATAGAGLGLAIVRAILEGHGGQALLRDPVAGPGAVFVLRLPLGHDHEGEGE